MQLCSNTSKAGRRARRMGPSCRGGASSVLRLTQPALARLPAGASAAALASIIASLVPTPSLGLLR